MLRVYVPMFRWYVLQFSLLKIFLSSIGTVGNAGLIRDVGMCSLLFPETDYDSFLSRNLSVSSKLLNV